MADTIERAHETFDEAHHAHEHGDSTARRVAVLVSVLAAVLALAEVGEKSAQNEYLTRHIAVSDDWAFYQAKNQRAQLREAEADLLQSLPNAADPAVQARIKAAQGYVARERDDPKGGAGMKQIAAKARAEEAVRDAAFHRYHGYELAVGALEIAIVLASVSVVTRIVPLALGAGAIGAAAAAYAATVWLHLL